MMDLKQRIKRQIIARLTATEVVPRENIDACAEEFADYFITYKKPISEAEGIKLFEKYQKK